MENRRELSRINLFFSAELILESGKKIKSSAGAINIKGVFFVGGINAKIGDKCEVIIFLSEEIKIVAKGIIRRNSGDGVGVEFLEIIGQDSYIHLKGIMQQNAEDQHSFLKELEGYVGIKKKTDN
ncbi:MAG: hypothetical protein COA79_19650 [Planctomycetota bacterium]|nr:MAG: hypothetical protein COA79_19650 [Planctomycetota bacterium]